MRPFHLFLSAVLILCSACAGPRDGLQRAIRSAALHHGKYLSFVGFIPSPSATGDEGPAIAVPSDEDLSDESANYAGPGASGLCFERRLGGQEPEGTTEAEKEAVLARELKRQNAYNAWKVEFFSSLSQLPERPVMVDGQGFKAVAVSVRQSYARTRRGLADNGLAVTICGGPNEIPAGTRYVVLEENLGGDFAGGSAYIFAVGHSPGKTFAPD